MAEEVPVPAATPTSTPTPVATPTPMAIVPHRLGSIYPRHVRLACRELFVSGLTQKEISARMGLPLKTVEGWSQKQKWLKLRAETEDSVAVLGIEQRNCNAVTMPIELEQAKQIGTQRQLKLVEQFDKVCQKASTVLTKIADALDTYDPGKFGFDQDPVHLRSYANEAQLKFSTLCADMQLLAKTVKCSNDVMSRLTGITTASSAGNSRGPLLGGATIKNAFFQVSARPLGKAPPEEKPPEPAIEGKFTVAVAKEN